MPVAHERLALALAPLAVTVWMLLEISGVAAAILGLVGLCSLLALVSLAPRPDRPQASAGWVAGSLLPGVLVAYLGFNAGGYFPMASGFAAAALALFLAFWLALGTPVRERPRGLVVAILALAGLAAWTFASQEWSDAPLRAWTPAARTTLYALALAAFGVGFANERARRWALPATAAAVTAICATSLVGRLAPEVFTPPPMTGGVRISYPLGYWNGIAVMSVLGLLLALHLSASASQPRGVRVMASASAPALAVALLLTFSRGGTIALAAGLAVYLVLGWQRGLVTAAAATLVPSTVAVAAAYSVDALARDSALAGDGLSAAHRVGWVVLLSSAVAAVSRVALFRFDGWMAGRDWRRPRRTRGLALVVIAAGALTTAAALTDVTERLQDRGTPAREVADGTADEDARSRFGDFGDPRRSAQWRAVLRGTDESLLTGSGAETFSSLWLRHRPREIGQTGGAEAHSLHLETLGELGIVGLTLLTAALAAIALVLLGRWRASRDAGAALGLAVLTAWLAQAEVDWIWEITASGVTVLAVAAAAIVEPRSAAPRWRLPLPALAAAVTGLSVVAVTAALLATSDMRLTSAAKAFDAGDCERAVADARDAQGLIDIRSETHRVIGLCAARRNELGTAVRELRRAVELDRHEWRTLYDLAGVLALRRDASAVGTLERAARAAPTQYAISIDAGELRRAGSSGLRAFGERVVAGAGTLQERGPGAER